MGSRPVPSPSIGSVAVALLAATGLSTLLPWTVGTTGSVIGVRHDDAFLVIAASVLGIVLYRMKAKAAWIAPGFATFAQFRDIRQVLDAELDVGIGLWLGIGTAALATALLVADLVATIRANAQVADTTGS